jgi:glycosyltransferase involved in cell wall biosynthesis
MQILKQSVCMATHNGERYVFRQLTSILDQLGECDELIICDDASSDRTVEIIESFNDPRVVVLRNPINRGVSATFSETLKVASGDLIFMSDQDDVWEPRKVERIRELFQKNNVNLVVHDAYIVSCATGLVMGKLSERRSKSPSLLINLLFNSFTGCCMAFDRKVLETVTPIDPAIGVYHDAWIGVLARMYGLKIIFAQEPLIQFMRHDNNASQLGFTSIRRALNGRAVFYWALLKRFIDNRR